MNGWKQVIVTIILAGLAAFGGLQVGLARSETRQDAMDKRLDRMEDKIDWLIRNTAYKEAR